MAGVLFVALVQACLGRAISNDMGAPFLLSATGYMQDIPQVNTPTLAEFEAKCEQFNTPYDQRPIRMLAYCSIVRHMTDINPYFRRDEAFTVPIEELK